MTQYNSCEQYYGICLAWILIEAPVVIYPDTTRVHLYWYDCETISNAIFERQLSIHFKYLMKMFHLSLSVYLYMICYHTQNVSIEVPIMDKSGWF